MTISTLDKWMEEEPEPSKYIHIFINVNELNSEFESRDKVVNYKKLLTWLKKLYGIYVRPILYMGVYDKDCINLKTRKKQETQLRYLTSLGYQIKKCVKYHKITGELIEKGAEVSMAIDLEHYAHPISDKYDQAVVLCNELAKYHTIFKNIQTRFKKKIKVYSFSQEYENHYQEFKNFIQQVGDPKNTRPPPSTHVHYEKPFNYSNIIGMLNQNTLRSRFKSVPSGGKEKPQAFMFIDYGNIHHSLRDLKKIEKSLQTISDKNMIIKLRNKAQKYNDLKGVIMYMGMPHTNIAPLQKLRKKNEQMKAACI